MDKKLLFLLHLPPPFYGVTKINKDIIEGKIPRQFHVDVVSINTAKTLQKIDKKDIGKLFIFVLIFFNVFKKILFNRYDLCYFSLTPTGIGFYKDFILVLLLKAFRVKIVYHLHGKGIAQRNSVLEKFLYKISFKNSQVIIMAESLFYDIERYVSKNNIYILPNGIEVCLREDEFERLCIERRARKTVNLLFLSHLIKTKGIYVVLQAAKILDNENLEFKLYLMGSYGDVSEVELRGKIEEYKLEERVKYLGFKEGREKYEQLKQADIFVYPTLRDAFPLVLLEAMQFGLSVVSTKEGAIPDIVDDGACGFLVPKQDAVAVAEKLKLLINNLDLRVKMGEAARRKSLSEYTFDKFEDKLAGIFNQIIVA